MSVDQYVRLRSSEVRDEFVAVLFASWLAPVHSTLGESDGGVAESEAWSRARLPHGSRRFEISGARAAGQRSAREIVAVRKQPPNTSVEPTARAASVRTELDSSFAFTVSSARLPRLWLTLIR